jgi:AraC-like DNA-binding protein
MDVRSEWVRYWRVPDAPVEAMRARFTSHAYHRHSHESYSFGITESGAQAFSCRRSRHVSRSGLVMAFNPDDPHDGRAGDRAGFTYRMIHIWPDYFAGLLAEISCGTAPLPLFREPVIDDPELAVSVLRLHAAVTGPATALDRYERLISAARSLTKHARRQSAAGAPPGRSASYRIAGRVRELLQDAGPADLSISELADAAGCSRYVAYRAFTRVHGLTPSEYQRQVRLRAARGLLAAGVPPARAAAEAGFADQAHLTRWFRRCYGVAPAAYRAAAIGTDR